MEEDTGFATSPEGEGWIKAFLAALKDQSPDYLFILLPHQIEEGIIIRNNYGVPRQTPLQAYDQAIELKKAANTSIGLMISEELAQKQNELNAALDFYCQSTGLSYTYVAVPITTGEELFALNGSISHLNGIETQDAIERALTARCLNVIYCPNHHGDVGQDEADFKSTDKGDEFMITCRVCGHTWRVERRHFRRRGSDLPNPFTPIHVPGVG